MITTSATVFDLPSVRRPVGLSNSLEAIHLPVEDDLDDDLYNVGPQKPWVGVVAMVASATAMVAPLAWAMRMMIG